MFIVKNCWTWIIKLNILPITWQSITAIGRWSSEIPAVKKAKKEASAVKHKAAGNYRCEQPKYMSRF